MNLEEAMQLGNRHLVGSEKFEMNAQKFQLVRITASSAVAATPAGQHCLWMLTNLLARQFGVITALEIDVPAVPSIPQTALFGLGRTLRDTLINTGKLIAGNALDICGDKSRERPAAEVGVGHYEANAPFSIAVLADGWKVMAGKPDMIPLVIPESDIPFGPYFGACLAAGEIFKHLAGMKPDRGRTIEHLIFSLWDYRQSDSWESADPGVLPKEILLPPFYLVGVGAVGQAAVASLSACASIRGHATLIDDEAIDKTNRNRYVLAHAENLGVNKVIISTNTLARKSFQVVPYVGKWEAYVQNLNRPLQPITVQELEQKYKFQRVLSCVDKNDARHSIQNLWPELILGGSTNECGMLVQAYDLRKQTECLKCSNPIKEDNRTIESETERWKQMTPSERQQIAEKEGLNLEAIELYLKQPKCGELGEQEIAKFVLDSNHEWSVGFVSVAAGVLLAAKLLQSEIAGIEMAFPAAMGQALRFSFLNPGPYASRHPQKESCDCSTKGKRSYQRLWG